MAVVRGECICGCNFLNFGMDVVIVHLAGCVGRKLGSKWSVYSVNMNGL